MSAKQDQASRNPTVCATTGQQRHPCVKGTCAPSLGALTSVPDKSLAVKVYSIPAEPLGDFQAEANERLRIGDQKTSAEKVLRRLRVQLNTPTIGPVDSDYNLARW